VRTAHLSPVTNECESVRSIQSIGADRLVPPISEMSGSIWMLDNVNSITHTRGSQELLDVKSYHTEALSTYVKTDEKGYHW